MRKKLLLVILALTAAFSCAFGLAACDTENTPVTPPGPTPVTQCTVIYDANGGTFKDGNTTVTQIVDSGSALTAPASPSLAGSAFGGWAKDKNGKVLWQFAVDKVEKDMQLYAVWTTEFAAITSVEGATVDEQEKSVFMLVDRNTQQVSLSDKVICTAGSTWKLYYDKLGQTEIPTKIATGAQGALADGDNVLYIVVTSSDGSQTNTYELTVHRSRAITVSFYDNKDNLIRTDTAYTGFEYSVTYTPSIDGYTFNRWEDNGGAAVTTVTSYEPVSLYADCTANTYTAALNVNGGDALEKTEYSVTYDAPYTLAVPTRENYTFAGWYCGETRVTRTDGVSLLNWTYTSDKTLIAKWTANGFTVTLNKDVEAGGTVAGDGEHDYGENVTITATTNAGYTWLGWFDADGEPVSTQKSYTFTLESSVEYTAKWIACPVTVKASNGFAGSVEYAKTTDAGEQYTATATTKSGYVWLGWYQDGEKLTEELSYTYTVPSSADDAVTYTAKWIKAPTVRANDSSMGTVSGMPDKPTAGEKVTLTATTSKLGYIWLGWYNGDEKYTDEYSFEFTIPSTDEITYNFIAKWEFDDRLNNFEYELTADTCVIKSVKGTGHWDLLVPEYVTSIREGALADCGSLRNLTLPFVAVKYFANPFTYYEPLGYFFGTKSYSGGVAVKQTRKGYPNSYTYTYYFPENLRSVTVAGGIIPENVFDNCSWWFGNNRYGVESVILLDGVTEIEDGAFSSNALKSVTIGSGVTSVTTGAFDECGALSNITVSEDNEYYCSVDNILYDKDKTELIYAVRTLTGEVTLPSGLLTIDSRAFRNCRNITAINLPSSLTSIADDAFYNCNRLEVVNITDLAGWCKISGISNVIIKSGDSRGVRKLYLNGQELSGEIELPEGVTGIPDYAFYNCSAITRVTVPENLTSIGENAFDGCGGLTEIIIPLSVNKIGANAFSGCGNLKIYCEAAEKPSGWDASWDGGCPVVWDYKNNEADQFGNIYAVIDGLKYRLNDGEAEVYLQSQSVTGEIEIPVSVTYKDTEYAVTAIASSAFKNCTGVTGVVIPDSIVNIGNDAFKGCNNLESITVPYVGAEKDGTENTHFGYIFGAKSKNYNLESVPTSLKSVTVTGGAISNYAFYYCKNITDITVCSGVSSVGALAFDFCNSLESINVDEDNVNCSSQNGVLYNKEKTQLIYAPLAIKGSVIIPEGVTKIASSAFKGRSGLESVEIPKSISSIGENAFNGCILLKSIEAPVCIIEKGAFGGCTSLESLVIPYAGRDNITDNVTTSCLGYLFGSSGGYTENAQYVPSSLKHLTIRRGDVAKNAVRRCYSIESLTLLDGVTSIGEYAFDNCSGLTDVYIGKSVQTISSYAFNSCTEIAHTVLPSFAAGMVGREKLETVEITCGDKINANAFRDRRALKSVKISDEVQTIGDNAFSGCASLESLIIPVSVTSVGADLFYGCTLLNDVYYEGDMTSWFAVEKADKFFTADFTFYLDGQALTGEIRIPDNITIITAGAFENYKKITGVEFHDEVVWVYPAAFANCSGLTNVKTGKGLKYIDLNAFKNCSNLLSITLHSSLLKIDSTVFYGCSSLESVTVPDSVTTLGKDVFYNCSGLTEVVIGRGITSLDKGMFYGCSSLESVTLPFAGGPYKTSNTGYKYPLGYIFGTTAYAGGTAIEQTYNSSTSASETYYIPATLKNVTVRDGNIFYGAFHNCNMLENVTLGDGVETIAEHAFRNCGGLKGITISEGLKSIEGYAFINCGNLTEVAIPDSVESIGSGAFRGCSSIEKMTLPFVGDSAKTLGSSNQYPLGYIFGTASYEGGTATEQSYIGSGAIVETTYYIPTSLKSVTVLGTGRYVFGGAFGNCSNLTEVVIGDSVIVVYAAFNNCTNLISVTLGENVYTVDGAFNGCSSLESVTIPESVATIGSNTFKDCVNLESVSLSDGVTKIGSNAFANCSKLTELVIPDSVTEMGNGVFSGCTALVRLTLPHAGQIVEVGTGMSNPRTGERKYPFGYLFGTESYEGGAATVQSFYAHNYSDTLNTATYYIPTSLKVVTVTSGEIYYGAFKNCSNLVTVYLTKGVMKISNNAFNGCSSLATISIGSKVTEIGAAAFNGCSKLFNIKYTGNIAGWCGITGLENIMTSNRNLFIGGKTLTGTITIPEEVTSIPDYAFFGCRGITGVSIPDSVESIGEKAFGYCVNLASIVIPDSVTEIGESALYGCSGLVSLTLPFVGDSSKTPDDTYQYPLGYIFGTENYDGGTATVQEHLWESSLIDTTYYLPATLKSVTITGGHILRGTFYNCRGIEKVIVGKGVQSIVENSFAGCDDLVSVIILAEVTSINYSVFSGCSKLESIVIPKSVISIGEGALHFSKVRLTVYYGGTAAEWGNIEIAEPNDDLTDAEFYYYSEEEPAVSGSYWHYGDDGITPVVW